MWQTHCIETARGRFEVFKRGAGPPLCVTHLYSAFDASGDLFADCFTTHRTVYLINLRGAGGSQAPGEPHDLSMDVAAEDLEAIRAALGYAQWDFAGHSTGGMLGLLYAETRGGALRSLVAVGAAASRHYADTPQCIYHPEHPAFQNMQDLIEALKSDDLDVAERRRLAQERTKLSLHQPTRYAEYFPPHVTKRICAPRLDYYAREDFPRFDLRGRLENCKVQALIACGRHDVQCPLPFSREIADLMPRARLALFEESNHYPFLEEPIAFDAAVQRFFRETR
ncbi:MAG: alpha/beta hydrolase [Thermaerobacter sp.]|nr:alpha/beta hydrolase [Thermaerobacter sp.]